MIFIYGDSHAYNSFKNLSIPHVFLHQNSVTMFRIGRDNMIVNYDKQHHNEDSIVCLVYGEVDCRCHVARQKYMGRNEDDIINELVYNYFNTIKNNISQYKKIVIVGVIPTTNQTEFEKVHGPITHEFPFVGSNDDRVHYTTKVNILLKEQCQKNDYIYFDPYYYYTSSDGTLKRELSDTVVHLGDNSFFLEKFIELYNNEIM